MNPVDLLLIAQITTNRSRMVGVKRTMEVLAKLDLRPPADLENLLSSLVELQSLLQWMREELQGSWYVYLSEVEEWGDKFASAGQPKLANDLREFVKKLYPHTPKTQGPSPKEVQNRFYPKG